MKSTRSRKISPLCIGLDFLVAPLRWWALTFAVAKNANKRVFTAIRSAAFSCPSSLPKSQLANYMSCIVFEHFRFITTVFRRSKLHPRCKMGSDKVSYLLLKKKTGGKCILGYATPMQIDNYVASFLGKLSLSRPFILEFLSLNLPVQNVTINRWRHVGKLWLTKRWRYNIIHLSHATSHVLLQDACSFTCCTHVMFVVVMARSHVVWHNKAARAYQSENPPNSISL